MVARITYDLTVGTSAKLKDSIDAWAAYLGKPRSEYCREILEKHQNRVGLFPKREPENLDGIELSLSSPQLTTE